MPVRTSKRWLTPFELNERTLVIRFPRPRRVISSAVRSGGLVSARAIISHQVSDAVIHPKDGKPQVERVGDPSRTLGNIANQLGLSRPCVGLMTAVDLHHLVLAREQASGLWVEGFFTVGVTNAARAGEAVSIPYEVGTINIILITNAKLALAGLVGAVSVATESKTATLLEKQIPSCSGRLGATGTGTDAIVIAIGDGPRLRYSGTHTKIGELIGRVVARGVTKGLSRIEFSSSSSG